MLAVQGDARGRVRQLHLSEDPPIVIGLIDDAWRSVIAAGNVENESGDLWIGLRRAEHCGQRRLIVLPWSLPQPTLWPIARSATRTPPRPPALSGARPASRPRTCRPVRNLRLIPVHFLIRTPFLSRRQHPRPNPRRCHFPDHCPIPDHSLILTPVLSRRQHPRPIPRRCHFPDHCPIPDHSLILTPVLSRRQRPHPIPDHCRFPGCSPTLGRCQHLHPIPGRCHCQAHFPIRRVHFPIRTHFPIQAHFPLPSGAQSDARACLTSISAGDALCAGPRAGDRPVDSRAAGDNRPAMEAAVQAADRYVNGRGIPRAAGDDGPVSKDAAIGAANGDIDADEPSGATSTRPAPG